MQACPLRLERPHLSDCQPGADQAWAGVQDDLICLPPKQVAGHGGIGPMVLCTRVTNTLTLLDPTTLRTMHLDVSPLPLPPLSSKQTPNLPFLLVDLLVLPWKPYPS